MLTISLKVDDWYHSKGDSCSFTKNKKRRGITQDVEMSLLICCKGKYDVNTNQCLR